jgi:hypothetical protein
MIDLMRLLKDFLEKLKVHLLPRIREIHQGLNTLGPLSETQPELERSPSTGCTMSDDTLSAMNQVVFKANRMYRHALCRVNYTTYDLRRETDAINPSTDNRDIMLLAGEPAPSSECHPFSYARVLGIYHANVIFIGPGSQDYQSRRMDFLWVRWFEPLKSPAAMGWERCILDKMRFVPMHSANAFGFVDPANVLRSCHLMPAFADGRLHPDRIAASQLAGDADDWKCYYINRYGCPYSLHSIHQPD